MLKAPEVLLSRRNPIASIALSYAPASLNLQIAPMPAPASSAPRRPMMTEKSAEPSLANRRLAQAKADADRLGERVERRARESRDHRTAADRERKRQAHKLQRSMREVVTHRDAKDRGTPGTRRQRLDSGLRAMMNSGLIWAEMRDAATEIEEVFLAQTAGLMSKGVDYSAAGGRSVRPTSDRLSLAYAMRYKPWADELSTAFKAGGRPALAITVAIVIDDMTMRQAEQDFGMRRATIQHLVRRSLLRYAEMARRVPEGSIAKLDRDHPEQARGARVKLAA